MFEESLEDYSLKLTKKVKNMILKVVQEHPCSLLMGFSDYVKRRLVQYL